MVAEFAAGSGGSQGLAWRILEAGNRLQTAKILMAVQMVRWPANELDKTRQALEERKLIDRARGIVMKQRKLDEEQAYALLRKLAMESNMRLADVAQSVITAAKLFK